MDKIDLFVLREKLNEEVNKIFRDNLNDIDYDFENHIHHLDGFYLEELETKLYIKSIIYSERQNTINETINLELSNIDLSKKSREYIINSIKDYLLYSKSLKTNKIIKNPSFIEGKKFGEYTVNVSFFLYDYNINPDELLLIKQELDQKDNQLNINYKNLLGGAYTCADVPVEARKKSDGDSFSEPMINFIQESIKKIISEYVISLDSTEPKFTPMYRKLCEKFPDLYKNSNRPAFLDLFLNNKMELIKDFSEVLPKKKLTDLKQAFPTLTYQNIRHHIHLSFIEKVKDYKQSLIDNIKFIYYLNSNLTPLSALAEDSLTEDQVKLKKILTNKIKIYSKSNETLISTIKYGQLVIEGGIKKGYHIDPLAPPAIPALPALPALPPPPPPSDVAEGAEEVAEEPIEILTPKPYKAELAVTPIFEALANIDTTRKYIETIREINTNEEHIAAITAIRAGGPIPPPLEPGSLVGGHVIIDENFTSVTIADDSWRTKILKKHIHELFYAHNGLRDEGVGLQILEEIKLHKVKDQEEGYMYLHSYLHMLDEVPLLNFEDLVTQPADSRPKTIKRFLIKMRLTMNNNLKICLEKKLNSNRTAIFEKNADGRYYLPYKIVEAAQSSKYRQMNMYPSDVIRPEFVNVCTIKDTPYVAPDPASDTTDIFPNDNKLGLPIYTE